MSSESSTLEDQLLITRTILGSYIKEIVEETPGSDAYNAGVDVASNYILNKAEKGELHSDDPSVSNGDLLSNKEALRSELYNPEIFDMAESMDRIEAEVGMEVDGSELVNGDYSLYQQAVNDILERVNSLGPERKIAALSGIALLHGDEQLASDVANQMKGAGITDVDAFFEKR